MIMINDDVMIVIPFEKFEHGGFDTRASSWIDAVHSTQFWLVNEGWTLSGSFFFRQKRRERDVVAFF